MKTIISTFLIALIHSFVFATPEKKQIELQIIAPGMSFDRTEIYFDIAITPIFTAIQDVAKIWSVIPNTPAIYSLSSDNIACSSNGYSELNSSEMISLGVKTTDAGNYIFRAAYFTSFDASTILRIEDKETNVFTNLRSGDYSVQLAQNADIIGRFVLHISRRIQFSTVASDCANMGGAVLIHQDNTVIWSSSNLFDSLGNLIGSFANISGPFRFDNLPEGEYIIVMAFENYVFSDTLQVSGIQVGILIQPTAITAGVNEEITFHTAANHASTYHWNLGNGTWITGVANPTYSYDAPGSYKVLVTCTNSSGCVNSDSVTVTIHTTTGITDVSSTARKVSVSSNTISVAMNEELTQDATIIVYNLVGQIISSQTITDSTTRIALSTAHMGYYLVSVENDNKNTTSRIFIGQ